MILRRGAWRHAGFGVVLAIVAAATAHAQGADSTTVAIVDRGPGFAGRVLDATLRSPHLVIGPGEHTVGLPRGRTFDSAVVVLGRDATVSGRVRGDVVVVGGNLFVHPGAVIEGRAVAIGGTAVASLLANVRDGYLSFRDETFVVETMPLGGYTLRYRAERVASEPSRFPNFAGIGLPAYDRVNGLTIGVSPTFSFADGRFEATPGTSYRSNLGAFDPSLQLKASIARRVRAEGWVGRGTFSNDEWIYATPVNSLVTFATGRDHRNYFRADRGEARLFGLWEGATWHNEPYVGARWERAWSVGPDTGADNAPWSIRGSTSDEGMRRPNPRVDEGQIASALAGLRMRWEPMGLRAQAQLEAEYGFDTPEGGSFGQITANVGIRFPTFLNQVYALRAHAVGTFGPGAPPQRWAYLGGTGTLRTLELLEMGGDQLVFIEQGYAIPFAHPRVPKLGAPTLVLRHMVGSAGVGGLPALQQELGLRLALGPLRGDVVVNAASGHTRGGVGLVLVP